MSAAADSVRMIPVDQIEVANPRHRSAKAFKELMTSISDVGLKKPITVTALGTDGGFRLVCGQGRLEAFKVLRQEYIPAFVRETDLGGSLLMSLVENIARRQRSPWEFILEIDNLFTLDYGDAEVALKTGLSADYVSCIRRLLERGEQRLLMSIETGTMPITVALQLSEVKDANVQEILRQAYETGELRGRKLSRVKAVIEKRRRRGKTLLWGHDQTVGASVKALVQAYEEDTARKQRLVERVTSSAAQLSFIVQALHTLLQNDEFNQLLQANGLLEMPAQVSQRLKEVGAELGTQSIKIAVG